MADHTLDAKGLVLPLALVRLKQFLDRVAEGDTICFGCDTNGVAAAIDRYLAQTGHEMCSRETEGACETVIIRKC